MKITENFVAQIESVKYKEFINKNKNNEEMRNYICNATIKEVGRGMAKSHQQHNVVFYLNEEDFTERIIEKGDRINIFAGAKWKSQLLEYKSFDEEKIKNADTSQIKIDDKGRRYLYFKCFAYKIECRDENSWSFNTKWYDQNYCTIINTGVKLPLEDKKQFEINDKLDFFLDPPEMRIINKLNGTVFKVIAYSNKNKFAEKNMLICAEKNENDGTNYLLLQEVQV